MSVASLEWVAGFLVISAIFFQFPNVRARQTLFALCSIGFLAAQGPNLAAWTVLAVFLAIGYGAAQSLAKNRRRSTLGIYLSLLVASFLFIKRYSFLTSTLPAGLFELNIVLVGVSYMLFRQIHLVVDVYEAQVEDLSLWNYLNYQLNLFGLLAGPIQRYQEFCEYWGQLQPVLHDRYEILKAYRRLFWGVIKVLGLASLALTAYSRVLSTYLEGGSRWQTAGEFVLLLYLYPAYLYLNFSGYCDIVIAGASLLGMRMPENFNFPFLSRNIGELWTRWHRTLGFWIRDYLFTPLFKGSVERWPEFVMPISFASYFIAYTLAGLWHGSTSNFFVFGILNGLGAASAKLWEMLLVRRHGRSALKAYLQSRRIRAVAVAATISYFSFTLIFWSHGMRESVAILKRLATVFAG